ncbi:MAG TPA: glycosyltransferase family 9 protein [Bryobacteraceae bacterium]|nr:glycosyltransferase family 9 protein [Bryobacteraceae bacterium]
MRRLLIRPGAIGDTILSLPALEAARGDYTEVWASRAVLPLIRFAGRTRAIADTGLELVGVVEDARVAALEEFDSIYSWYGSNRPEFREAVRHLPFEFFPALPPPSEGVPRIAVPPAPRQDFIAIHPFASSPAKRWPLENFRAVAASLGLPVQWTAGPGEPLEDAVRFEDLYDLARWLASARLYIGNDSGIAHLAAAVGTPVLAIFLSSDPRIWSPRGKRVTVLASPSPESVLKACRLLLGNSAGGRGSVSDRQGAVSLTYRGIS